MFKRLKTVSMALLLIGGLSFMFNTAYAEAKQGASTVSTQAGPCKGIVKDATGQTVIGASIMIKGTNTGAITGIDGDFVLEGVKVGDILQISCIGYKTIELAWDGNPIDVVLAEDTELLQEVVVVGFGTQKKSKVTGSVSTLSSDEIAARPVNSVIEAMQGAVPGMNVSTGSLGGALNSSKKFNIRGQGNLGVGASVGPLVLIDGMEGDINALNPQDIETMSVLKDASMSAIYGSRAAGGVILITTKSGKEGKTVINYNNSFRFNSPLNMPKMMDSYTWAQYMDEASVNSGYGHWFSQSKLDQIKAAQSDPTMQTMFPNPAKGKWEVWDDAEKLPIANTDWLDEHFGKTQFSHEHNLSFSGGSQKIKYYFSANFLDQNGILKYGDENKQRYTVNGKINAKVFDWMNIGYSVRFSRVDFSNPSEVGEDGGLFYHNACRYWPILPTKDPNGNWLFESYISRMKDGGRLITQDDQVAQQFSMTITPVKGWTIHGNLNYRIGNWNRHTDWLPVYEWDLENNPHVIHNNVSSVKEDVSKSNYFMPEVFTEYEHDWNGHYMKAMVGFQAEKWNGRSVWAQRNNIQAGLPTINTTSKDPKVGGDYTSWATAGFFGRLNYDYKGRYMVEASFRYDGSSRFLREHRWGFFPSFSLGWNIAKESFMDNVSWLDGLTIRGSWGELGNQNTTDQWGNPQYYPFFPSMGFSPNSGGWLLGGQKPNIAGKPGLVSQSLTWETLRTWEVGLDWALLNNRLQGTFGYFQRKTLDMVGPAVPLPGILGTDVPKTNNTELTSKGWDLQISWRDVVDDFSYGVTLNMSDNFVVVDKYPTNDAKKLDTYYEGMRLGDIWGFETVGIAKTQEEMDAHLAHTNQDALGSNWSWGDIMYKDIDGDGKIDQGEFLKGKSGDYQIIGNSTPRYNFGLNIDMAYKGFDLKVFFQGTLKRDYRAGGTMFWGGSANKWQACGFEPHMDYFRPADTDSPFGPNVDAYYPRVQWDGSGKNQYAQTKYLQNAAYARLKNLTLGYTLPENLTKKIYINNLRFFVSLENMLTITSFSKMADPELIDAGGWDFGKIYPLSKTVSFGVNVTL